MNLASPSLVRYIERAGLPTRTSCDWFIDGVASYLAVNSWLRWYEERGGKFSPGEEVLDRSASPAEEAVMAAHFFAGGLVVKDPEYGRVGSLAVVLAGAWRRMWPDASADDWIEGDWAAELGWLVACEAAGEGVSWADYHQEHGLHPPVLADCDDDFFAKPPGACSGGAVMKRKRIIIVGPGGSGKDHLAGMLAQRGYKRAVSCTTRPRRKNELDGVDYHFLTNTEFRRHIRNAEFREWYSFGADNWLYGTLEREFQKSDLFIMSPPVLRTLGQETLDDSVVVYLDIPVEVRRARLEARADADSADRRLFADANDFHKFDQADVTITDPEFSVGEVLEAVQAVQGNAGAARTP